MNTATASTLAMTATTAGFTLSNEIWWLILLFVGLSLQILFFSIWGKEGLFLNVIIGTIIANLQVVKTIMLFGFTATLGNVVYGSIFLSTDLLEELYGKKEARKAVWFGFASLITMTLLMQIALQFKPAPDDFAQPHLEAIFSIMPRIALGSLTAYLIAQFHDVWAFGFWRKVTGGKHLWLRNNFSTMVSQLIDTTVFCTIAFLGEFPMNVWWQIFWTTYIFKFIVAAFDTPFIYLGVYIARKYFHLPPRDVSHEEA